MKRIHAILILASSFIFAGLLSCSKMCSKSYNPADDGCIEINVARPNDLPLNVPPIIMEDPITQLQIDTIEMLFTKNNLPFANLQFTSYFTDNFASDSAETQVMATPFINGLPVFNDGQLYEFMNSIFNPSSSVLINEVPDNNTTSTQQSLPSLRQAFFAHVQEATITGPAQNSKPSVPSPSAFADTCLSATLGYLDLSYIPGNSFSLGHVVKVWAVTPVNGYYPTVYVRDDTGQAWGVPIAIP